MIVNKYIKAVIIQKFDTETGKCIKQTAYEQENMEPKLYFPYDMVQPK